jgi:hypothetical protein
MEDEEIKGKTFAYKIISLLPMGARNITIN